MIMEIPQILTGKAAVVTGGVRGIGRAISEAFAKAGADLILTTTRDKSACGEVLDHLRSFGGRVELLKLNVSDKAEVAAQLPEAVTAFGGVDILVNNAGITRDGLMLRMSEQDWDEVLAVDLKSAFNTVQAVLPFMSRKRSGSIINVSSVVA